MAYRHLFGPVRSRRLGRSLGIDLVPANICSLDCVYCECGKTLHVTQKRAEYVPVDEVTEELDHFLLSRPEIDAITLGGTGEPTLHSGIGEILDHIKEHHPGYRIAVLTNSTLLHNPGIRKELYYADLILPSLDAVSDDIFTTINRPPPGITTDLLIDGLVQLRNEWSGPIWLEIFLIPTINTHEEELQLLRDAAVRIRPDQVHLNSLSRRGAEAWVPAVPMNQRMHICRFFREKLPKTYII